MVKKNIIHQNILKSITSKAKLLPDKFTVNNTETFIEKINQSIATYIFVGGSTVEANAAELLVSEIKKYTGLHIASTSKLKNTTLEVIPTGCILIENGRETAVQRVTETQPMPKNNIKNIVDPAKAGEFLGMKRHYLETGSGATEFVAPEIISLVKQELQVPLIVG